MNDSRLVLRLLRLCVPVYILAQPLLLSTAHAHHSQAAFQTELQDVEGVIESIIWRNPHPVMTLKVEDASGEERTWQIQVLANVNGMNRNGVTGDEFQPGDRVRLTGKLSRYHDELLLALEAVLEDGSSVRLGPDTTALGSVTYGGRKAGGEATAETQDDAPSLFRVWTVLDRTRNFELPMRESTRAEKERWDPLRDDHQRNCTPIGMPGAMMSPHPIEFRELGENIELRLEEWDGLRTIYMSEVEPEGLPSRLGHSIGSWDGSTLMVTTREIGYPYLDEYGTPQSEDVELVEKFTLSDDGRYLDWSVTVTDPATFTEPFELSTTRWEWVRGETLQDYDCAPTDDLLVQ